MTDDFAACFGFATSETLAANFSASSTLQGLVGAVTDGKWDRCETDNEEWLRDFVYGLFHRLDED